jgi:hypothetical protein
MERSVVHARLCRISIDGGAGTLPGRTGNLVNMFSAVSVMNTASTVTCSRCITGMTSRRKHETRSVSAGRRSGWIPTMTGVAEQLRPLWWYVRT